MNKTVQSHHVYAPFEQIFDFQYPHEHCQNNTWQLPIIIESTSILGVNLNIWLTCADADNAALVFRALLGAIGDVRWYRFDVWCNDIELLVHFDELVDRLRITYNYQRFTHKLSVNF